ncbi:MAG TPA: 16S rRNA (uracil(1498)-N(3))-methyltransferase [Caulobacteraceae bacterium]|jgi:16S rRNA (uracil1498-N3)-methyltransferase|nr:16S rRNA (uracil(1498)-N(3))-methyltransferase [Caulobacteraceae bacterium]
MIRLFVPEKLKSGATIALGADQAHYLHGVMRRGVGDQVLLFNGADGEWRAGIAAIDRRSASLALQAQTRPQTTGPDLEMIVAVVKRPRLETIVEKAAELGARRVRLAVTRFTQGDRVRLERLGAIAAEASEQTGRLDVPEITAPEKLDAILDAWAGRTLIFCDEGGDASPMLEALNAAARGEGTGFSILIGPEGGFAPEERARLRSLPHVIPVSLGPRILRADTAAIAALALWQSRLGDWSP